MKTNVSNPLRIVSSAFALVALTTSTASALVVANALVGPNDTFSVSSTDLADVSQGGTLAFTGTANFGSNVSPIIDGSVYGGGDYGGTGEALLPSVGDTLTLNLTTTGSSTGWDIGSITVLTGGLSAQHTRVQHSYSIAFSTDGTNFSTAIPYSNILGDPDNPEVQVTFIDDTAPNVTPLATGVKALRFTFDAPEAGDAEKMYREIDVFAVVPEPSTFALLSGFCALGVIMLRRRR